VRLFRCHVHYLAAGIISLSLILTDESLSAVLWRSHLVVGHLPLNLVTYARLKSGILEFLVNLV